MGLLQNNARAPVRGCPGGPASGCFPCTKPSSFNQQNPTGNICSRCRPQPLQPLAPSSASLMSLINESFGSCRGDASDAGERSAAPLPPALPGERWGPSPPALSPRDVPRAPMSRAATHSPLRPPRLRGCRRLPPVSQRCRGFTHLGGFCQGSYSVRMSCPAGQAAALNAPALGIQGTLCSIPFSMCSWQPHGSRHPNSLGQPGGYGLLSASSEPRGARGARGRAVPGRHQPQHTWGPGPYSPTPVASIRA